MLLLGMTLSQKKEEKMGFQRGKRLIRPVAPNSPLMDPSSYLSVSLSDSLKLEHKVLGEWFFYATMHSLKKSVVSGL